MIYPVVLKLRHWTGNVLLGVIGLALGCLVTLELAEVLLRYAFLTTLSWSSDVSGLLLLTLGWVGAVYVWLKRSHLVVDLIPRNFSRLKRVLEFAPDVLMILTTLWLFPVVLNTMSVYGSMIMPALSAPASLKFIPTLISVPLLAYVASLNLAQYVLESSRAQ